MQSSLSETGGQHPIRLPPHSLPSVSGSGCRGAGCHFHFLTPFCDNSFYFLYLSGNGVVGAKYEAKLLATLSQSPPLTQHLSLVLNHLTIFLGTLLARPGWDGC